VSAEPVPDLVTPLVAFRSWRLSGGRLVSPFIPCRWDGRVMHATCFEANRTLTRGNGWLGEPHTSPDPRCQCGIYGYFRPGPRSWYGEAYWCEGVVTAWGRVEVHRDGFRAEHARVEALATPEEGFPHAVQAVREAAGRLGVPLLPYAELEAHAARLGGADLPPALRPV
jgi:hypothetical protein